jgi:hypothetical protein
MPDGALRLSAGFPMHQEPNIKGNVLKSSSYGIV